jgi:Domain of unknown function (DUF4105)
MKSIFLIILLMVSHSKSLWARDFIPPMPNDLASTKVSLLTVGLGEELFARYGHTMLRIEDRSNNLDYLVNWGIFDFSDPFFIPKFFQGVLIYRMGFSPTQPTTRYYRDVERRSVVQDEVNLNVVQKRMLMEKIIKNAQPENVLYPYQFFRNNCATIPRDLFNDITKGEIVKNFGSTLVNMTYRDYVRTYLGINPLVGWGLDIVFNGDNDFKLSKWQEMFFPDKLREHLSRMPSYDENGQLIPGESFLKNHMILVDLPEPNGKSMDGYWLNVWITGFPLIGILLTWYMRRRGNLTMISVWQIRLFGLVSLWWGLTCGFFGSTHSFGWMFSSHTDAHRNLNILMFWPTDFVFILSGCFMLVKGLKITPFSTILFKWSRFFAKYHLIFIPIFCVCSLSGFFSQDTSRVLIFMVPLSILYNGLMCKLILPNATKS